MSAITVTHENVEKTIEEHPIVLLDFWASWCGPCRQFAPVYEAAATNHPDLVFGSVDTEAEQGLAAAAQIQAIPTLMAFKNGTLVFNQAGALTARDLEELIRQLRALDLDARGETEASR